MGPQERITMYGSLDLAKSKNQSGNSAVKLVVGLAFVGIAIVSSVLALLPTATTAPASVVDETYESIDLMPKYTFEGDDLTDEAEDCVCVDQVCHIDAEAEIAGIGTCEVTSTDGNCIGFDFEYATMDDGAAVWSSACELNEGRYDCYEYPCKNKGYCVDGVDSYKCVCPFGWEGDTCEEDIDECGFVYDGENLEVCNKAATCINSIASYACECQSGWYGDGYQVDQDLVKYGTILVSGGQIGAMWLDRSADDYDTAGCLDIDDCASSPCAYGTTCTDEGTNVFACDCTSIMPELRYDGDICDMDVNECDTGVDNCDGARAECTNTPGSFECKCREFWEGDGFNPQMTPADYGHDDMDTYNGCTDIDDCTIRLTVGDEVTLTSPCKNGATCSNDGEGTGLFHCECVVGWESELCDVDVNECVVKTEAEQGCHEHATCTNTEGSWECLCDDGWTGDGLALHGGFCFDADDCEFSPCMHGGTCTDYGWKSKICQCIRGYRGKECEIDWNECTMGIHTCHDMALCINTPGSFECECEPGFSGDGYEMCNSVDDCLIWEDDEDTVDEDLVDYGERVYLEDDVTIDTENSQRPVADAVWLDDYPATAASTTTGDTVVVHQCGVYSKMSGTFAEHGTCRDVGPAAFICNCDPGWSDTNCDLNINECARGADECHRYATCTDTEGSYECACNWGYSGDGVQGCTDIDDCVHSDEICKYGICTDLGAFDFRCTCTEGYMDRLCDFDIDECATFTHNCHGDAECENNDGSFNCVCPDGYDGDGLLGGVGCMDLDDCGINPCEHGECTDNGRSSYSCACDVGWKDMNCDYDENECLMGAHDCHGDAKCVNTLGGYYCRCVSGYEGDGYTCLDLDDCDPDPCDPQQGTCSDVGQNKYYCECNPGYMQPDCTQDQNECMDGSNNCHVNAACSNTVGSYTCACKPNYYGIKGNGETCTKCTDCKMRCETEAEWDCGHGPGYERDYTTPACDIVDLTCIEINECGRMTDNCDNHATCDNSEGSFTCTCNIDEDGCYDHGCTTGCFWGEGTTDNCAECYICEIGEYMHQDATSTTDRICKTILPDGDYAIRSDADGVEQCLVKWKEEAKVFPERYAWGGKAPSQFIEGAAEECDEPICGVCDWDGKTAKENILEGLEAVWTFKRLRDDLYMIMSHADGKGYRCLGFQVPDAPYPTLISWTTFTVQAAEGVCVMTTREGDVPVDPEVICTEDGGECDDTSVCYRANMPSGNWELNQLGADSPDNYFCGYETDSYGLASEKLIADGGAVWNVHALGCEGKLCENRIYESQYVLRSLVRGDRNMDNAVDQWDYECIYFPDEAVQQYTHPVRVPTVPSQDGIWLGGSMSSDLDANSDPECGIYTDYEEGGVTQEAQLVANKQATFMLIPLF